MEPSNILLDTIYNNSSVSYGRSRKDIKDDSNSVSYRLGKIIYFVKLTRHDL